MLETIRNFIMAVIFPFVAAAQSGNISLQPAPANVNRPSPYVLLNPYFGHAKSTVTVTGYGFDPGETVRVDFNGQNPVGVKADPNGYFTNAVLDIPQLNAGSYKITAHGLSSGIVSTTSYYLMGYYPAAWSTMYDVRVGDKISLRGLGFAPNEQIVVKDQSDAIRATFNTDSSGKFSVDNAFTINQNESGKKLTFSITQPAENLSTSVNIQTAL